MSELRASYDADLKGFPDEMVRLATRLTAIHGYGRMARESHGVHLYLPSPKCLEMDGDIELQKAHLTVNLSKYFESGKDFCAQCHKTSTPYSVSQLLSMPKLEERGIQPTQRGLHIRQADPRYLVKDDLGRNVPRHPGITIPIDQLPQDHICMQFLASRNMADPLSLYNLRTVLEAEWCENYHDMFKYRWAERGFPNSPSKRLILYNRQYGSCYGWQARAIEFPDGAGGRYYLNPASNGWYHVPTGVKIELQKYINAYGTSRQSVVYGYDAAIQWNSTRPVGQRLAIVGEGPLDIPVIGAPMMALTGKYASPIQLRMLVTSFDLFMIAADDDDAGKDLRNNLTKALSEEGKVVGYLSPSPGKKDVGESDRNDMFKQILDQMAAWGCPLQ